MPEIVYWSLLLIIILLALPLIFFLGILAVGFMLFLIILAGILTFFNQESFPETFELINHLNQSAPDDAHKYGYYAILYTPVIYRPTFMIVGNNPSWFDKDSNDNALILDEISVEKNEQPLTFYTTVDQEKVSFYAEVIDESRPPESRTP